MTKDKLNVALVEEGMTFNIEATKKEGLLSSEENLGIVAEGGSLSKSLSVDDEDFDNGKGARSPSKSLSEDAHNSDTNNGGASPSKSARDKAKRSAEGKSWRLIIQVIVRRSAGKDIR